MKLKLNHRLVSDFVVGTAGEGAHEIVLSVKDKGLTDDKIAKITKLKVNDIRAILNKLHFLGIITYSKEKAKKSNWYTYTWFLKRERIVELLGERYREELEKMEKRLHDEENYVFFNCGNGCDKLPFELACEYDFRCPLCGGDMEQLDDDKEKEVIKSRIQEIKKFLS